MAITIIAVNQTGSPISFSRLNMPDGQVPGSGQATLTDYNTVSEIQNSSELLTEIQNDNILLNDGTNTLTKSESLRLLNPVTFGVGTSVSGTIMVYDPITNTLTGSSVTIDATGNLVIPSGSVSVTSGQATSGSQAQYVGVTASFVGNGSALTNIPNGALDNSSVTLGTTTVSLGATATKIQGVTEVTGSTLSGSTGLLNVATVGVLTGSTITGSSALLNNVTVGTISGDGGGLTGIPNGGLDNSSVTLGTTTVSLGATATKIQGVTEITGSTISGSTALLNVATVGTISGDGSGLTNVTDADAVHDNVAGEIAAITEKTSTVGGDWLIIEDSQDSNNKKAVRFGNLTGSAGADELAKVSSNDTTAGYLNGKLVAGTGITFNERNDGGNETLEITSSAGSPGGSNYSVQFNSGSVFSGSVNLLYNYDTNTLSGTLAEFTEITASYISASLIELKQTSSVGHSEGTIYYDLNEHTLTVMNDEVDVRHQLGQEGFVRVRNESGGTITNGSVVYISGSGTGGELRPAIALALSNDAKTSEVIGVATHDIENNTYGYVTTWGKVNDVDTSAFADGDTLRLSDTTAGGYINTSPAAGSYDVIVGYVVHSSATTGSIFVQVNADLGAQAGDASELVDDARKASAGTINPGQVVYVAGWNNGQAVEEVELAQANAAGTMPAIGIARDTITNNTAGKIVVSGRLSGIDTSGYSVGDALYVSGDTAGALTNLKPSGSNLIQKVALVVRSNADNGVIEIVGAGRSNDLPTLATNNVWLGNSGSTPTATSRSGIDDTAVHDNVAGEIAAITEKTSTVGGDWLIIEDSQDSNNKKAVRFGNLTGSAGADELAKVSANDTTAGYLNGKLVAGTNITFNERNDGGNETLEISGSGNITIGTTTVALGGTEPKLQGVTEITGSTISGSTALLNTVTVGTISGDGGGLTGIPNGALDNSSVTIGTTAISLGGSATTIQGITELTGSTITGSTGLINVLTVGTISGDGSALTGIEKQKAIIVTDPVSSETFTMWKTNVAVTVAELNAVVSGSGSPSVNWQIRHATDRTNAGNAVMSASVTTTSTTTGDRVNTFTSGDPTIPAGSWVWLDLGTVSGTPDHVNVTIDYTID